MEHGLNDSSCRTETFLLCFCVLKSDQNLCILTSYNSLDLLFGQAPVSLALFTFLAGFHWRASQAGKVFQFLYIFLVTFCSFHSDSNASSLPHIEFFNLFRKSFILLPWSCLLLSFFGNANMYLTEQVPSLLS